MLSSSQSDTFVSHLDPQIVVIGAGIGGLAASIELAGAGHQVTLLERAMGPGGKMREVIAGRSSIDAGPTVLTMRWVFEEMFAAAGLRLDEAITLEPLSILARHAWPDGARLDLHAQVDASTAAIGAFAGAAEARAFRAFNAEARRMYDTLRDTYLTAEKPNPLSLAWRVGLHRPGALLGIRPFETLWSALRAHFKDERLRQLFGRYATYCGASPFQAPATLMLIAHVEQEGVWTVRGGMQRLADALAALACKLGVTIRYGVGAAEIGVAKARVRNVRTSEGDILAADAVVCASDPNAIAQGLFGDAVRGALAPLSPKQRSLSAITWAAEVDACDFPLHRHNVAFSPNYTAEFDDIAAGRPPERPTTYICAQDQPGAPHGRQRLLLLTNAPAHGDISPLTNSDITQCENAMLRQLHECGLTLKLDPAQTTHTHPAQFNSLFPATGGALYGRATHGWAASFFRPGSRTRIPGLYLAGGGAHPGPGVPMAALSGRLAAAAILKDRALTRLSRRAAMPGGMSTPSAATSTMG